jgi:hypothetical protein
VSRVSDDDVLLLWRALRAFRSGKRPLCSVRASHPRSSCPLYDACPRWREQPDDWLASLDESIEETERRRSSWPCTRLLDLLAPGLSRIGS